MYICRFAHGGDMFPPRTTSIVERSYGLQEAYNKICSNSANFFTTACWCHEMTPCQVSWFSGVFWIYKNFKTKFLNVPGRATTPRCLNFIPISCMGPRNSPKGHTCGFSTNFGALEHVLVVQIWIMHIKCRETQLMHKNAKRTWNNSKFKDDTHVVACSIYINVLTIQTPSFPSVKPLCLSKHNEKSGIPQTVY